MRQAKEATEKGKAALATAVAEGVEAAAVLAETVAVRAIVGAATVLEAAAVGTARMGGYMSGVAQVVTTEETAAEMASVTAASPSCAMTADVAATAVIRPLAS